MEEKCESALINHPEYTPGEQVSPENMTAEQIRQGAQKAYSEDGYLILVFEGSLTIGDVFESELADWMGDPNLKQVVKVIGVASAAEYNEQMICAMGCFMPDAEIQGKYFYKVVTE